MLELIKTENLPEDAQVCEDIKNRALYFMAIMYSGYRYYIPLTGEIKKMLGISIRTFRDGKARPVNCDEFKIDKGLRDIIHSVYLQIRDTVGAEIHDEISRQVSDGLQKMFQVHLARAIDKELDKKLLTNDGASKPSDWEFCPNCHDSLLMRKLEDDFICPWCHKDVRTSDRIA